MAGAGLKNPSFSPGLQFRSDAFWMIGCLLIALPASAATRVCGIVKVSTDWTASGSPYIVTNDLYIPQNVRLTIEPGVEVMFTEPSPCSDEVKQFDWADSVYTSIKVDGALFVLGKEEAPIKFGPSGFTEGKIAWDGIRIRDRDHRVVEIAFAWFRGAHQAIQAERSEFYVHHCLFAWNNVGVQLMDQANLHLVNNNFLNQLTAGIYLETSIPRIYNNILADNLNYGIWADSRRAVHIQHNAFWQNAEGDCYRCPYQVLRYDGPNARGDSADVFRNLRADPVFVGSDSYLAHRKKDVALDTPPENVKDSGMAALEKRMRKSIPEKKEQKVFQVQGEGPYRLSKYSRLVDAGLPEDYLRDRDGSPNDIGMHGGPMKRMAPGNL